MTQQELIADRYEVLDTLGQGGMATVYLAKDKQLDRLVAVKMLLMKDLTDGQAIRFQNEAKAIGKLKHGAIMTALDFGVTKDGQPYLVLDYKEGTTLDTILKERGRLEIGEALLIASRICDGLAYAHKAGILHRDIKPPNIYIADSEATRDSVKILDFGIAKFQSTQTVELGDAQADGKQSDDKQADGKSGGFPDEKQYLTRTGALIGSPAFMSPEQARGERVDERADIYSLGCVLFEMLTGKPPIMGDTTVETIAKKATESAPTLASQAPDIRFSNALESIVAKSLAADRSKRYQKATDFHVDLESQLAEYSEEEGIPSEPVEPHDRDQAQTSEPRAKVSAVAVVMVLLVMLIGSTMAFFMFARPASDKDEPPKNIKPFSSMDHEKLMPEEAMSVNVSLGVKGVEIRRYANDADFQRAVELLKQTGKTSLIFESLENFDGDKLRYFEDIPIQEYKFQRMTLDKKALERINNTSSLLKLSVDGCKLLSTIISKPERLPHLQQLSVKAVALTDEDCRTIPKLKSLSSIVLEDTSGFTPDFLKMLNKISTLRQMFIGGDHWTDEHIKILSSMKLLDLEVSHSQNFSADTLMSCLGQMKFLVYVHISDMRLGDSLKFLENSGIIQFIKFNRATALTKAGFVSLSKMKRLNHLEFVSIGDVTNSDILPLLNSTSLKRLDFDDVPGVTEDALSPFNKQGIAAKVKSSSFDVAKLVGPQTADAGSAVKSTIKAEEPPGSGNISPSSESTRSAQLTKPEQAAEISESTDSSSGWNTGAHTIFNNELTCELKGTYTEKDMLDLVETVKTKHPNHRGFSMGHVDNFNSAMLKHLIPLKPTRFKATGAELDQAAFRYLGQMTSLTFLGLDNNPFTPGSLQMLKRLQNVTHLSLSGDTLNDADLDAVASMKSIEKLNLKSSSGFTLKALEKLRKLPHLTNLQIGGRSATPEQARCFHGFKNIRAAELSGHLEHRASDILKEMSSWPNVERLTFSSIELLPEHIEAIAKFPSLKDLKLSHLSIKDKDKVLDLLTDFKLESLEFELIANLKDTDVVSLRRMKNCRQIIFSRNGQVTDSAISQLQAAMPHAEVRRGE